MGDIYDALRAAIEEGRVVKDLGMQGARLDHADLDGLKGDFLHASGSDLTAARLRNAHLVDCDFPSAVLRDVDFSGATLWQCQFRNADVTGGRFEGARAENNFWSKADFSRADFRGAHLSETLFDSSSLRNARLDGSQGTNVRFNKADLTGAALTGASFPSGDFRGAILAGADLSRGDFRDADFRDTILQDVCWTGANLEGAQFDPGAAPRVEEGTSDEPNPGPTAALFARYAQGRRVRDLHARR